jgi:type IV pilus assembly protein PilP
MTDKTSAMPEKKDAANAAAKYDPTGKTDPFKSFIAKQEEYEKKKKEKPRTYLETLELSQLDLIAVIVSKNGNWAMVQDSKGMGHVVRKGTPIGTNDGIIKQVREREIVVQEKIRDLRGNINVVDTIKKMPSRK